MHEFMMQCWGWLVATPLVGAGIAVVVALMLWKQPRQTLKLAAAILVLVALGYAVSGIMDFVMSSMTTKELMVEPGK